MIVFLTLLLSCISSFTAVQAVYTEQDYYYSAVEEEMETLDDCPFRLHSVFWYLLIPLVLGLFPAYHHWRQMDLHRIVSYDCDVRASILEKEIKTRYHENNESLVANTAIYYRVLLSYEYEDKSYEVHKNSKNWAHVSKSKGCTIYVDPNNPKSCVWKEDGCEMMSFFDWHLCSLLYFILVGAIMTPLVYIFVWMPASWELEEMGGPLYRTSEILFWSLYVIAFGVPIIAAHCIMVFKMAIIGRRGIDLLGKSVITENSFKDEEEHNTTSCIDNI